MSHRFALLKVTAAFAGRIAIASAWLIAAAASAQPAASTPPDSQLAAQPGPAASMEPPSSPNMTMREEEMDDEQARAHFRVGRRHYDEGRFEEAARDFEEAFQLSNRPELLFNIFVAWREAQDFEKAADALERYLRDMPSAPDRPRLEQTLTRLRASIAQREQERLAAATAAPRTHSGAATGEASEAAAVPNEGSGSTVAPWIVAGVGAAMIVAGSVTGGLALDKMNSIEEACPNDRCSAAFDLEGNRGDLDALTISTDILLFGGIAVAGSGLLWALLANGDDGESPPAALACLPGTGCQATVRMRF